MAESPRTRRLRSDHRSLAALKSESTIFDFIPVGDPPDQYVLRFRGRGVYRPENSNDASILQDHEVLLRLGAGYPRSLPSLTWRTPIFHPNIASSGVVCLGAYGQHWAPSVTLEELVTMLWDMVRYANFDVDSPYNREAAIWAKGMERRRFPLDPRPLRDITAGQASMRNVIPSPHVMRGPSPVVPVARAASGGAAGGGSSAGSRSVTANTVAPTTIPLSAGDVIFLDDDVVDAEVISLQSSQPQDDGILFIS